MLKQVNQVEPMKEMRTMKWVKRIQMSNEQRYRNGKVRSRDTWSRCLKPNLANLKETRLGRVMKEFQDTASSILNKLHLGKFWVKVI